MNNCIKARFPTTQVIHYVDVSTAICGFYQELNLDLHCSPDGGEMAVSSEGSAPGEGRRLGRNIEVTRDLLVV